MNLISKIRQVENQMTPTDHKISEALFNDPDFFARNDTSVISQKYNFSQPALTRFAKKIGYSGYADFKYDIARNKNILFEENISVTLATETSKLLQHTETKFTKKKLEEIVEFLDKGKRIFVSGFHRSRACAELMNASLVNYRYSSQMIPYDEVFKLDAFSNSNDILIVFSVGSSTYKQIIKQINESPNKPKMMLITCTQKHELARYFDKVIVLPDRNTIKSPLSLDPAITSIFFINLLSMHFKTQN